MQIVQKVHIGVLKNNNYNIISCAWHFSEASRIIKVLVFSNNQAQQATYALRMGSVVNMLVTDLSTNRSPLEGGRPNTEATLVSPGVTIEGNPSDVGLNVTPSI